MKIGTYYYPEQWPRDQWERDFDKIASIGMKIVHMAEFAWFDLEPSPGDFRLDWLSDCVEMAAKRKLDVILCTPTAAPPVWLTDQFPEVLGLDRYGAPGDRHGGRRHYTPTSPRMLEASHRIVTAMAERFGDHPSIIGWQI
ncbi:MAG: beta-galactosidase, partial [Tepidisphaeraceae bacterium]